MDDEERAMLDLPPIAPLCGVMLREASEPDGITAREMHRRHPETTLEDWMCAGWRLFIGKKVTTSFKACPQPDSAVQQLCYKAIEEDITA